jgi:hypothetical protein
MACNPQNTASSKRGWVRIEAVEKTSGGITLPLGVAEF